MWIYGTTMVNRNQQGMRYWYSLCVECDVGLCCSYMYNTAMLIQELASYMLRICMVLATVHIVGRCNVRIYAYVAICMFTDFSNV